MPSIALVVVQLLGHVQLFLTPWTAARQASLSFTAPRAFSNSCQLSRWCDRTISSSVIHFSSCLQSFPASGAFPMSWLFTSDGHKYWSFSFSTSASNEYLGLISFRIDWFDLLAVQRTLKSLIQHHGFKASVCWHSAFFMVQLSHLYMTTGKTIALTIGTFVGKIMSLLFNMLSMFIIAFLPRSKCLLGILYLLSHLTDPSRRKRDLWTIDGNRSGIVRSVPSWSHWEIQFHFTITQLTKSCHWLIVVWLWRKLGTLSWPWRLRYLRKPSPL